MEYLVHRREVGNKASNHEYQVEVEYAAAQYGYKLRYQVAAPHAYDIYVELESDLEFLEFKLRCLP